MEPEDLQKTAHSYALQGKSFFLTGGAGTGKTYTLHSIIKSLKENKKRVAVTACTDIALQQFDSEAKTLHSFAGYSFETKQFDSFTHNWNNFDVLIIDEISSLSSIEFKAIEKSAQLARGNDLPMGGMQTIGCGDFYQLPPTYNNNPLLDRDKKIEKHTSVVRDKSRYKVIKYAFSTSRWDVVFPSMVNLTKVHRQTDMEFINILNRIRSDNYLEGVLEYIIENCGTTFNPEAPYIYATNKQVNETNNFKASKLKTCIKYTDKSQNLMSLAVGVPVIGLVNTDQMKNGSRGVVVGFEHNGQPYDIDSPEPGIGHPLSVFPVIQFQGYDEPSVIYMVDSEIFPIAYGWAMTIQSSQGMTFESLNVDVSKCTSAGQVYVALSRVPDPSKMNVEGYHDSLVKHGRFVSFFYYSHLPIERIPGDPE
ncbi:similar to Saccharomyces cerevisiae YML061C PIF1 DNA helicase [Geotrichum candidum]|uniref:ATP-dependent DNA helicase n=1 Tax=Geotrichum candidum TaxID=1173061 RepID=A0A0J9XL86_GEOCN|nr:similar to Saccharomyces cerevisiae YML061C PIF1 DNA helicase [Geotrichum candidum]